MDLPTVFFTSAIFFLVCYVVICINIMRELEKRNIKVNFLLMRILILKYLHQYHQVTIQETGHPGPLFYYYIISINLAWVLAVIGLIVKRYA